MEDESQTESATKTKVVTKTVVISRPKKSMGIAVILTAIFGPFGLLYASLAAGLILIIPGCALTAALNNDDSGSLAIPFMGLAFWLLCMIVCVLAVKNHNQNTQ